MIMDIDKFNIGLQGAGLKISICPEHPKLRVKEHVPMTDAFRAEMNQWLLDMFGTESMLDDNQLLKVARDGLLNSHDTLLMNRRTYDRIMDAVKKNDTDVLCQLMVETPPAASSAEVFHTLSGVDQILRTKPARNACIGSLFDQLTITQDTGRWFGNIF